METEIWKSIAGYNGSYQVSNFGRVRSLPRKINHNRKGLRNWDGRILSQESMSRGYKRVMFGDRKRYLVHRLVAAAFIPNKENKPCVNHIDGNPQNNCVNNLDWCTYSENEKHSYSKLGKVPNAHWKGKKGYKNPFSQRIALVKDGHPQKAFASIRIASRILGWSESFIKSAANTPKPQIDYKIVRISNEGFENLRGKVKVYLS